MNSQSWNMTKCLCGDLNDFFREKERILAIFMLFQKKGKHKAEQDEINQVIISSMENF